MGRLILVRHGQIAANLASIWHGSTDSPLTETGREQARRVGERLRIQTAAAEYRPVNVITSPLERTRHTAEAIGAALSLQPQVEHDLREYAIGELEGTPYQTLLEEHRFFDKVHKDHGYAPPGGESLADVCRRVVDAFTRIASTHQGEDVVVVGHGAAIGVALGSLLEGDPTRWNQYGIKNCSITELRLHPVAKVLRLNDVTHLL